ncbi:MAG: hypothetical protein R6U89_03640 [Dehalococcoidia bacterium]
MHCDRHPKVETNLRCGKCERPICPKCAVQTPVGARCPDCAKRTRLPVFQVAALDYAKAVGTGLGLAAGTGVVWGIAIPYMLGFGYLLALPAGYIIGELIGRAVRRKHSTGLQIISGGSVVVSYAIALGISQHVSLFGLIALAVGIIIAAGRFR